ncbi:MAG: SGNH/GDSL hydrolase family protein [Candidatus Heimdallarchaeota archaeon]|nr:SGNH/GDSL hydrolase family protein [Candidatus Heimdallarchaeota archaeon]
MVNPVTSSDSNFNMIFVGDSITEGSIGTGYISKLPLYGNPWNSSEVHLVNSGVNGRSMRYYYQYQEGVNKYILDLDPDVVFVYLGLNDLNNGDVDSFKTHYEWLLQSILDNSKSRLQEIFLIQFSWAGNMPANAYIQAPEYNLVIAELATKYDLRIIDLWEITETHHEYFVDGVHPNDLGANVIASKLHNETKDEINQYLLNFRVSTNSESVLGRFVFLVNLIVIVSILKVAKRRIKWVNL